MGKHRIALVLCAMLCWLAAAPPAAPQAGGQSKSAADEQAIWELERAYWRYVQANDLVSYRNLWHESFLGWPAVSPVPARKSQITDWITSQTSKGLKFKAGELKPAAAQITGDIGVVHYWIAFQWLDAEGKGAINRSRIMHTWLRDGKTWRIVSGMSMPEPAALGGQAEDAPHTVEYYYTVKWGTAEEWLRLFKKNHLLVLKALKAQGNILSLKMERPRYHATEDGRWDYRVTITWKSYAASGDAAAEQAIMRRLYPDQETFRREEQRRFEILIGHWDLPVTDVSLEP